MSNNHTNYDVENLHGTHYSSESFYQELENRVQQYLASDDEVYSEDEIANIRTNLRKSLYQEWNDCDSDQVIRFETANSYKHHGIQSSGFVKENDVEENPLLAPVHGLSLRDYTAMTIKITQGVPEADIFAAMGIEAPVWDELNTIWGQRMAEDTSFTVTTLFGQYFAENATHPKLEALGASSSAGNSENLRKLSTDRYFYEELAGAREAAYEYGLDGAQWILDEYGINLADFQSVAMQWMTQQNQQFNSADVLHFTDYHQQKKEEYAAKFAEEQGGNIADDIEF
ncbi:DUF6620 family protein [Sphingobacterium corticis]|uniref:DUF6620 family protein n=1 Tax=Sphingobacterium corticis TaxID=1812823 RepID=A0ABW5NIP4_9SPHI